MKIKQIGFDKYQVNSTSRKEIVYIVDFRDIANGICSCPAILRCKHIKEVEARLSNKGIGIEGIQ